jgi:hypothetical protein
MQMSRHRIDGLNSKHEVFVGWDPPLVTYFGQVYDPAADEDENPIHWVGAGAPHLQTVGDLAQAMAKYATLTPEMGRTLFGDKEANR